MKQRVLEAACILGLCAGGVQAEVRTGELVLTHGELDFEGSPLGGFFTGWHHGGTDYHEFGWDNESYALDAMFVVDSIAYEVGDLVTSSHDQFEIFAYGSSTYDIFTGETYYSLIGDVGEPYFLGFTFLNESGPETVRNYGFMQWNKVSSSQYEYVGYAYETQGGVSIEIFNIPSPSAFGVLGVSGLALTRRRRA